MKIIQIVFAIVITMFVSVSHAAILKVSDDGILLGADNVNVNGNFYNVSFRDGTCVALFGGCDDVSDFVFNTEADAEDASRSLLAQVFVDGSDGEFNSAPDLTYGCTDMSVCRVVTIFGVFSDSTDRVFGDAVIAVNAGDFEADFVLDGVSLLRDVDLASIANLVFAVWEPTAVSSPNVAIIMVMGIAGLLVSQRRRQV